MYIYIYIYTYMYIYTHNIYICIYIYVITSGLRHPHFPSFNHHDFFDQGSQASSQATKQFCSCPESMSHGDGWEESIENSHKWLRNG